MRDGYRIRIAAVILALVVGASGVALAGPWGGPWSGSGGPSIGYLNTLYCQLAGCTMTGVMLSPAGSATAPSIGWSADSDGSGTGIYRSAANQVAITNNGTQSCRFEADGAFVCRTVTGQPANGFFNVGTSGAAFMSLVIESGTTPTLNIGGGQSSASLGNTLSSTGTGGNLRIMTGANAASEIAVVLGTSANTTAQTDLIIGHNITGSTVTATHTFEGDGTLKASQTTTGTPPTWRVPTAIANDTITLPTCSTSADAGKLVYVDDSNDTAVAVLCVCRAGSDDSTYALVQVADNTTACIDP